MREALAALRYEPDVRIGLVLLGLTVVGWGAGSVGLAAAGLAGLLVLVSVYHLERTSLDGVGYRRQLSVTRAMFGDVVHLDVEITNDKALPVAWLQVLDRMPSGLGIVGGLVVDTDLGAKRHLTYVRALAPRAVVHDRIEIVCSRRGRHELGPTSLVSGDPLGHRERRRRVLAVDQLLVYPKLFALRAEGASRVPVGPSRSEQTLLEDPSRTVGVRPYRPGDALRQIDWRATARAPSLLVRELEPSADLRVIVVLDMVVPQLRWPDLDPPELEFAISVAASVVHDLHTRRTPVGLWAVGTVDGRLISRPPSTGPRVLPDLLGQLAQAVPFGSRLPDLLASEGRRLRTGTSLVVISANFTVDAVTTLRRLSGRGVGITTVHVATDDGAPPPTALGDLALTARFCDGWEDLGALALA